MYNPSLNVSWRQNNRGQVEAFSIEGPIFTYRLLFGIHRCHKSNWAQKNMVKADEEKSQKDSSPWRTWKRSIGLACLFLALDQWRNKNTGCTRDSVSREASAGLLREGCLIAKECLTLAKQPRGTVLEHFSLDFVSISCNDVQKPWQIDTEKWQKFPWNEV